MPLFNANIFNSLIFNTGGVSTTGRSGYFRLWLADLQRAALKDIEEDKKEVAETIVVEIKPHPIKENKDGSVTILPFKKKQAPKVVDKEDKLPDTFERKPMYREVLQLVDQPVPSVVSQVSQITSTLHEMIVGFRPHLEAKRKAENDEDEDVLFLLMAA